MSYIKHIFTFAASALVTLMLGACSDDVDMPSPETNPGDGYITISLSNARAGSRAEADVDALNENKIESVILALYPADNVGGKPAYLQTFDFTDTNTTAELKVQLTNALRDRLFPNGPGSKCQAYVIVNKPETSDAITADMTITEMQQIAVSADFADKGGQKSFVMDGSTADITYQKSGNREWASGTIDARRVASKITLAAKIADQVEVDGVKWTCDPSNMTVVIKNGVKNSSLNPSEFTPEAADYYNTSTSAPEEKYRQRGFQTVSGDFPYELSSPFYTFPNAWDAEAADNRQTYMTLMVPWKKEGDNSTYQTCYYTVPVTKGNTIGRNISYRVKINVNMLGSFTPDEPITLQNLSYYAVEWGSVGLDVDINEIRYLVVDQNAFTMNNEQLLNIPVYTSHPIKIKSIKLTYFRYNLTPQGNETGITINEDQAKNTVDKKQGNIYTCEPKTNPDGSTYVAYDHAMKIWNPLKANGGAVKLTNNGTEAEAKNEINSISYYSPTNEDEFSRYIAEITIVHADKEGKDDEALYTEKITITQYPQIYITSTANYYYASRNPSAAMGNMYVNGNQSNSSRDWNKAYGLYTTDGGTNSNSNQYVIHITQLNEDEDYIIGDPRSDQPLSFNPPSGSWYQAPALYDNPANGRGLKYYYPAESDLSKARWIAPVLRIASSYGICSSNNNYTDNRARCASYQELGYPAGRWRMPTVAEIEYIAKLSQDNKIPMLFNGGTYMSAQGIIDTDDLKSQTKIDNPTNTSGREAVRCVYDEWYWNDTVKPEGTVKVYGNQEIDKYPFTWGDRPR